MVGRWNPLTCNTPSFFFKPWTSQLFRLTRAKKILILPSKTNVLTVQPLPSDIKWYMVEFKGGFLASSFPWSPRDIIHHLWYMIDHVCKHCHQNLCAKKRLSQFRVYSSATWPRTASDYVTPGGLGKLRNGDFGEEISLQKTWRNVNQPPGCFQK